jgi:hypothetical protein
LIAIAVTRNAIAHPRPIASTSCEPKVPLRKYEFTFSSTRIPSSQLRDYFQDNMFAPVADFQKKIERKDVETDEEPRPASERKQPHTNQGKGERVNELREGLP